VNKIESIAVYFSLPKDGHVSRNAT